MGNKSMIFRFVQKSGIPGIPGLYRRAPRLIFSEARAQHGGAWRRSDLSGSRQLLGRNTEEEQESLAKRQKLAQECLLSKLRANHADFLIESGISGPFGSHAVGVQNDHVGIRSDPDS